MNKILSILLIVGGLALALFGYKNYTESSESFEVPILDVEVSLQDENDVTNAYVFMGTGVVLLVVGFMGLAKK